MGSKIEVPFSKETEDLKKNNIEKLRTYKFPYEKKDHFKTYHPGFLDGRRDIYRYELPATAKDKEKKAFEKDMKTLNTLAEKDRGFCA